MTELCLRRRIGTRSCKQIAGGDGEFAGRDGSAGGGDCAWPSPCSQMTSIAVERSWKLPMVCGKD